MTKKTRLIIIISAFILAVAAFCGGALYGRHGRSNMPGPNGFAGEGVKVGRIRTPTGADFMSGEILSKDDRSITLKMRDGNTKIIFYSESTDIGKFAKGSAADLSISQIVMVSGKNNPDGSLTAANIQIRPELSAPPAPAH
ncbi:hypothetical protein JXA05_00550 [Candidatus Peregrinibacteria bacterium]|nr:hypothetical protein [Candidatus Peregrinibacteria bacterium]